MAKLEIDVGRDLRSAAAEVATAWKAAAAGAALPPSDRIVFVDWNTLCAVLTADRYTLLRTLHAMPGADASSLGQALGRERNDVQADVSALTTVGLVLRDEAGHLSAAAGEISSTIRIAA